MLKLIAKINDLLKYVFSFWDRTRCPTEKCKHTEVSINYQSNGPRINVFYHIYKWHLSHLRLRLVFLLITGLLDYYTKLTGRGL